MSRQTTTGTSDAIDHRQMQEMLLADPSTEKLFSELGSIVKQMSLAELKYYLCREHAKISSNIFDSSATLSFNEFHEYVLAPFHPALAEFYPIHQEWVNTIFVKYPWQNVLIFAPVDSWKSTIVGVVTPLYLMYLTRGLIRLAEFSAGEDLPKKRLTQCRDVIAINERLNALGVRKPVRATDWGEKSFTIDRMGRIIFGSTMRAFGIDAETQGYKFDVGILDDVVSERNSRTEINRKNLRSKVKREVLSRLTADPPPPLKTSRFMAICTSYHKEDLNEEFGRGLEGEDPIFVMKRYKAVYEAEEIDEAPEFVKEQIRKKKIKIKNRDTGESRPVGILFPEKYPYPKLIEKKKSLGNKFFMQNFQQVPLSDEDRLIAPDLVVSCFDSTKVMGSLLWKFFRERGFKLFFLLDPAVVRKRKDAERKGSDYWVMEANAYSHSLDMRVILDFRRGRGILKKELLNQMEDFYNSFMLSALPDYVPKWYAENNQAQDFLVQDMEEVFGKTNVKGVTTTFVSKNDGFTGINGVSYVFERKAIIIPTGDIKSLSYAEVLLNEVSNFGQTKHDDTVSIRLIAEQAIKDLRSFVKDLDPALFRTQKRQGRVFNNLPTPAARYKRYRSG